MRFNTARLAGFDTPLTYNVGSAYFYGSSKVIAHNSACRGEPGNKAKVFLFYELS